MVDQLLNPSVARTTECGKAIVKKCGGVPLAIKALGSLMRFKSHEEEWLAVKESEIWHLRDDENTILSALRLSYDNLLPHMRQCFAYCCIFPKDYLLEENQLIQLWMANGYIPSDGPTDMRLTGQLIFKELVWRSFLQEVRINYRGNMICKMHELMHDLASSVMKHETYILEYNKKLQIPRTLRHLSFASGLSGYEFTLKLPIDHSLRSMIVHAGNNPARLKGFCPLLSKQKYLRAFDGDDFYIGKLPKFVCKLNHLRYLVIACNKMKSLPGSLTNLHNLQTLKLTDSGELVELPKDLKVMKNLWFLEMESYGSLLCTPPGLRNLTCLRRLSIFIVGEDGPHQIDQLKDLELGGKLSIQGLDNVRTLQDARSANLMTKSKLTSLSLYWKEGIKMKSAKHFEEVLQGLQPHQNVEDISIASYYGSRFPNWMSSLVFGNLKEISLEECPRCEHLPPLGKLPSLTCLSLYQMDSLKCLDGECYGDGETSFPALTSLKMSNMPNFERWIPVDSTKIFPCLERLEIRVCPKLAVLPKIPNLKRLIITYSSTALLKSIMFLTSITSLIIFGFEELDVLPRGLLQNHKALENLQISLPIRTLSNVLNNLSALKTLRLDYCQNLEFLPEDFKCLTSLRSLYLQNCKKLKPLLGPLAESPLVLHDLVLNGLPELDYLPENVQLLTSVRHLGLYCCEKLNSLPDSFKDLESLRRLVILGCPLLENRCKKPQGEDWPKISHIPLIRINDIVIQRLD